MTAADDTVRTQLARLEVRQEEQLRAVRERLDARTSESLRSFSAHAVEDTKRFDSLEAKIDSMVETITKNRVAIAAATATVAGVSSLVGSLLSHLMH